MADVLTKGKIFKDDLALFDGFNTTASRKTSTGGSQTLNRFDWKGIDVHMIYGSLYGRTDSAISAAHGKFSSTNPVKLYLSTGTWVISSNITLPYYVTLELAHGAILTQSAGTETITLYSPENLIADKKQTVTTADMLYFTKPGFIFPEWWGAKADGSTTNTNALQYCLNSAYSSHSTIQFNGGTYKTGTLTYHGQSMRGVPGGAGVFPTYYSSEKTIIYGLPGEDIFFFGDLSNITKTYVWGTVVQDLCLVVDDSEDNSASFTNRTRYGVGNAGFACEFTDGATVPFNEFPIIHAHYKDVVIHGASLADGGQNKSAGMYIQGMVYGTNFENVHIGRLAFGWFHDYPVANVTSLDFYSDINNFTGCIFNACTEPFQHFNGDFNSMTNCTIYSYTDGVNSLRIRQVTSSVVDEARKWNIVNLYSEGGNDSETEYMTIQGTSHHFSHCYIMTDQPGESWPTARQGYVNWEANDCIVDGLSRLHTKGGTKPVIKISGNNNKFDGIDVGDVLYEPWTDFNPISDTGSGNIVTYARQSDVDPHRAKNVSLTIHRHGPWGYRNADFAQAMPEAPYANNDDLLIWPNQIYWQGASPQPTITKDATLISGAYTTIASPGSGYFIDSNDRQMMVGYEVPAASMMFYICLKNATSSTTQVCEVKSDDGSVTVGSATLSTTTSWAVHSFACDFSASTVGQYILISLSAPASNQDVHLAWCALAPMNQWYYGIERSADPPIPKEGQFVMWMSDGTGKGDDGDVLIASTAGGVTNYVIVFDHSAGTSWW